MKALALALALLFAALAATAHAQTSPADQLATLINGYRVSKGLAPMAVTAPLECVASQVAFDRAQAGAPGTHNPPLTFSLVPVCGAGQLVGEISAGNGAGTSAAATLQQFINSPEHNAIMLDGGNALGCGFATGDFQGFAGFQSWVCDTAAENGVPPVRPPVNPMPPAPQPPVPVPPIVNPSPPVNCVAPLCGSGCFDHGTCPVGMAPPLLVPPGQGQGCFNCGATAPATCLPPTCGSTQTACLPPLCGRTP